MMRRLRIILLPSIVTLGLIAITTVTLPKAWTRHLVLAALPYLGEPTTTSRVLEAYVQSTLAAHVAARVQASGPDHVALERIMAAVREQVLTPAQVSHEPRGGVPLLRGFGYCDQINAAIASVAAHVFPRAQIYALYDPASQVTPHTIGRVWSPERNDWLYFDGHYDEPVIFTRRVDGGIERVATISAPLPARGRAQPEWYSLSGWVLNEYRASFAAYAAVKVAGRIGRSEVAPLAPQALPEPAFVPPAGRDDAVYARVSRAYAAARLDHLLDGGDASAAYLAVARDPLATTDTRAAEMASAAQLFAGID